MASYTNRAVKNNPPTPLARIQSEFAHRVRVKGHNFGWPAIDELRYCVASERSPVEKKENEKKAAQKKPGELE